MDIWYHVTEAKNARSIKQRGLYKGNIGTAPNKSGDGVYFFKSLHNVNEMVEYIGLFNPILIMSDLTNYQKLMDEDALLVNDESIVLEDLYLVMPPEAVIEYTQYLDQYDGGDTPAYDDAEVAQFKINLIDKYQIRPHEAFTTNFGHYSIQTCRVPTTPVRCLEIKSITRD